MGAQNTVGQEMTSDLKCLRCDGDMQLGKLQHTEQLYPAVWSLGVHQEPGGGIRVLTKAEAASRKQMLAEVLHSRTYVDAYRCGACGYIELSSTRPVKA